ncbi:lactate utilization protein C [Bacillaceae bacterium S4-13-56]
MTVGEIQNRDAFLDNLAKQLGRERTKGKVDRPSWRKNPQWTVFQDATQDELVDILEKQCGVIHTTFKRTTSDQLIQVLQETIDGYEGKSAIIVNDERNESFGLKEYYENQLPETGCEVRIWDPNNKRENVKFAEKADVGITFSDITLAESGTVTLLNDKDNGRTISLLPKTYIAIIPKSTIVARMTQAASVIHKQNEAGQQVPSCVSFITGPSNSADIEMNLIVGVHGPIKVTYIVVEDK